MLGFLVNIAQVIFAVGVVVVNARLRQIFIPAQGLFFLHG